MNIFLWEIKKFQFMFTAQHILTGVQHRTCEIEIKCYFWYLYNAILYKWSFHWCAMTWLAKSYSVKHNCVLYQNITWTTWIAGDLTAFKSPSTNGKLSWSFFGFEHSCALSCYTNTLECTHKECIIYIYICHVYTMNIHYYVHCLFIILVIVIYVCGILLHQIKAMNNLTVTF